MGEAINPHGKFDGAGNWKSFLDDSQDEAKLAVYLGLQHKSDLRHFALCWPVIKTWIRAPRDLTGLKKDEVFQLIQESRELPSIENPEAVWPNRSKDSEQSALLKKKHRLAWHLIQMSKDIAEYIQSSDLENLQLTQKFRRELSAILQHEFPMSVRHPRPELNPWKSKDPKELIDRCWSILSYVSWIPYLKSWENILSFLTDPRIEALLYDSKIPARVRPRPSHLRLSQQCSSPSPYQSIQAPTPIVVKVSWDPDREFDGKLHLWRQLAVITAEKKQPPRRDQTMTQDPRLCRSAGSFRDIIRRMMDCGIHGFNLNELMLSYRSGEDNCYYQHDALRSQWNVLKEMFSDPDNTNFVLQVVLEVHDGNGDVYETTELPPVL